MSDYLFNIYKERKIQDMIIGPTMVCVGSIPSNIFSLVTGHCPTTQASRSQIISFSSSLVLGFLILK